MATADFSSSRAPQPGAPSAAQTAAGAALQGRLGVLVRRRNAQKMSRAVVRAAIPGVGVAALSVLLYKLHIIPDGPVWAPAAMVGLTLAWGFKNGWSQRAGTFAAACDADRALGLDDRLGSALAFVAPAQIQRQTKIAPSKARLSKMQSALFPRFALSTAPSASPTDLVPALVSEAATRAQSLDPKHVYPLRFDRRAQILAVLSALLISVVLMPDLPLFQTPQQKLQVAAMQAAGEKLMTVAKSVQKKADPKAEEERQLAKKLEKLGQKMVRGRMTKRAALTELGDLKNQLQKAKEKAAKPKSEGSAQIAEALRDSPLQSQAGRKVQEQLNNNKADEAAKSLEKLADQLDKGQVSEAEKKKAAEDLQKTAKELRARGGEANKKAAEQMEQAAKQLQQPQSPQNSQQQQQQPNNAGQKQSEQGAQGQQPQPQGEKKQQSGPQGANQQKQSPQGQQQGQQNQSGQQQQGQKSQNQQQQGGQQGSQGEQGSQQSQPGDQQGASQALRDMANGLRQGTSSGGNSQNLQDMMAKLREAESQTGSNGGQQFGQGKAGSTSLKAGNGDCPPGADCRQSMKPGKDLISSDPHGLVQGGAGLGPRNNANGVQKGGGVSNKKSERTGDKRRYADVWSDRLPKTHAKIDRIKGKWGGNGEIEQMPTKGEAKGGQVKTPYYQVYESYKRDAEEAVGRESVPPAYKQPVKDYFESIKP